MGLQPTSVVAAKAQPTARHRVRNPSPKTRGGWRDERFRADEEVANPGATLNIIEERESSFWLLI